MWDERKPKQGMDTRKLDGRDHITTWSEAKKGQQLGMYVNTVPGKISSKAHTSYCLLVSRFKRSWAQEPLRPLANEHDQLLQFRADLSASRGGAHVGAAARRKAPQRLRHYAPTGQKLSHFCRRKHAYAVRWTSRMGPQEARQERGSDGKVGPVPQRQKNWGYEEKGRRLEGEHPSWKERRAVNTSNHILLQLSTPRQCSFKSRIFYFCCLLRFALQFWLTNPLQRKINESFYHMTSLDCWKLNWRELLRIYRTILTRNFAPLSSHEIVLLFMYDIRKQDRILITRNWGRVQCLIDEYLHRDRLVFAFLRFEISPKPALLSYVGL